MPSQDNEQNALNRRHFLRISALGSLALHPAISWAGRFMGQREPFTGDHLGIIGYYSNGIISGPAGMHLRWLFPLNHGFPNSFVLSRRPAFDTNAGNSLINGPLTLTNGVYTSGSGATLPFSIPVHNLSSSVQINSEAIFLSSPIDGEFLNINLDRSRPVRRVNLTYTSSFDFKINLYSETGLLESILAIAASEKDLQIFHEGITRIQLELKFTKITKLRVIETISLVHLKDWQKVTDLRVYDTANNPLPDISTAQNQVRSGYRNFYNNAGNTSQYNDGLALKTNEYRALLRALKQKELSDPGNVLVDYTQPYHELAMAAKPEFQPQQWLLWASMDPNIARLLNLYFVDNTIKQGSAFAYKIEAIYPNDIIRVGILDNISAVVPSNLNTRFQVTKVEPVHTGRAVFTPNEPQVLNGGNPIPPEAFSITGSARLFVKKTGNPADFNDSVFMKVTRHMPKTGAKFDLAKGRPIFPQEEAFLGNKPIYVDNGIEAGTDVKYEVNGIDLFGILQNPISSDTVTVLDLDGPPAPRNLRTIQQANGRTLLQFDYGGPEYFDSPDIHQFHLHRRSSLVASPLNSKFQLKAYNSGKFRTDLAGKRIYTFVCDDLKAADADAKFSQVTFDQNNDKTKVHPVHRNGFSKFNLKFNSGTGKVELEVNTESTTLLLPDQGILTLTRDNSDASTWGASLATTQAKKPVSFVFSGGIAYNAHTGILNLNSEAMNCKVLASRTINLSAIRDRVTGAAIGNGIVTELFIDRPFFQPDLFNNGNVNDPAGSASILRQGAGPVIPAAIAGEVRAQTIPVDEFLPYASILVRNATAAMSTVGSSIKLFPSLPRQASLEGGGLFALNPVSGMMRIRLRNIQSGLDLSESMKGGEIMVWVVYRRGEGNEAGSVERLPLQLKLLSNIYPRETGFYETLVMIDKPFNSFGDAETRARFFPVHEFDISSFIPSGIPVTEGRRDQYFTVSGIDVRNNRGPVAKAVQTISLSTKPTIPGPMPRSCSNFSPEADSDVPLPDASKHSMVCVMWDFTAGYRYELARASAQGICNMHRNLWMSGVIPSLDRIVTGLQAQTPTEVTITSVTTQGLPEKVFNCSVASGLPTDEAGLLALIGSRAHVRNSTPLQTFEILRASRVPNTARVELVMATRSAIGPPLVNGVIVIEKPGAYDSIIRDSARLRTLANYTDTERPELMAGAFALLQATPLRNNTFTDRVPGAGTERYFYKTRLVDAAENRGPWSPASAAIRQLDISAPPTPDYLRAYSLNKCIAWVWPISEVIKNNTVSIGLRFYHAPSGNPLFQIIGSSGPGSTMTKPFFASGQNMVIAQPGQLSINLTGTETPEAQFLRVLSLFVSKIGPPNIPVPQSNYRIRCAVSPDNPTIAHLTGIEFNDPQNGAFRYAIKIGNNTFVEEPAYQMLLTTLNSTGNQRLRADARRLGSGLQPVSQPVDFNVNVIDYSGPVYAASRVNTDTAGIASANPTLPFVSELRIQTSAPLNIMIQKKIAGNNARTMFALTSAGNNSFAGGLNTLLQPTNGIITIHDLSVNDPTIGLAQYEITIKTINNVSDTTITL